MLTLFEEFNKHAEIAGFKDARIKDTEELLKVVSREKPSNVEVQFFDAGLVASARHLYFAVLNALTAFQNGENISKSLAMEILLHAAAQRQIRKATELLGIKSTTTNVAIVITGKEPDDIRHTLLIVSKNINGQLDDRVLELSDDKVIVVRKAFEISNVELEIVADRNELKKALVDLVIEKMALLATQH